MSVNAIPVRYPEPNDSDNIRHLTFVRVEADDGAVGWGEAVTMWPESSLATKALVEGMAEILIGRNPLENVTLWRELKERAWWYGEGGIASFAIAAIDIALWDLKGKLLGQPVVNLLGGPARSEIPAIISTHPNMADLDAMAKQHGEWVQRGYQGVKVGFGKRGDAALGVDPKRDIEFVAALREAVPDGHIMVDVGNSVSWDVGHAIRMTEAFETYGVRWIEEPLNPYDVEGYRRLKSRARMLIAYGEREWTEQGYRRLLDTGTVDVVGVDPARAEGITCFSRVVKMVEAQNVWFNAHAWSSAITTAASLHVSGSSNRCLVFEFKPLPNPMQHEIVRTPFSAKNGIVEVPDRPGLGVEVIASEVERFSYGV